MTLAAPKARDAPKQPVQCAGINACKGQGWIKTASAKECTDKGGRVIAPKS